MSTQAQDAAAAFNPDDAYALADFMRNYWPEWTGRKLEDCAVYGRPLLPMIEQLERISEGRAIK